MVLVVLLAILGLLPIRSDLSAYGRVVEVTVELFDGTGTGVADAGLNGGVGKGVAKLHGWARHVAGLVKFEVAGPSELQI